MSDISLLPPGHESHIRKWLTDLPSGSYIRVTNSEPQFFEVYTRGHDGRWYRFGEDIDGDCGIASRALAATLAQSDFVGERVR